MSRQISHRNVCRGHDIGEADSLPFITMEYVDGENLPGLLRRIARLPRCATPHLQLPANSR